MLLIFGGAFYISLGYFFPPELEIISLAEEVERNEYSLPELSRETTEHLITGQKI